MAVLHIIKFVIKLLLFIVLLPFLISWFLFRIWHYKIVFVKNMMQSGMPKEYAKKLGKEIKLRNLMY